MPTPARAAGRVAPLLAAAALAACDPRPPAPPLVEAPAAPAASIAAGEGEIGFSLAGPGEAALLVPVFVNGQGPFDFVIDTGATLSCVDTRLAERLTLRSRADRSAMGATAGGVGQIRIVELDSLRVGEARASELGACIVDLAHARDVGVEAQGLLGLNFLRAFRVTFDFQRNVLTLAAPP